MKRALDTTPSFGCGSVHADELLTMREAGRRLGLANRALCDAQRQGLRTILLGRCKFVLGTDVLDFFAKLAERQAAGTAPGGNGHE